MQSVWGWCVAPVLNSCMASATSSVHIAGPQCFYVPWLDATEMDGQARSEWLYVQQFRPPTEAPQLGSIVLIHGAAHSGSCWTRTVDGRPGWAQKFAHSGFDVYVIDTPGVGRSSGSGRHRAEGRLSQGEVELLFTNVSAHQLWPGSICHTQWPGSGTRHDAIFDEYYQSLVPYSTDTCRIEAQMRTAVAALLDRIGPAVLITHSQSGPAGWAIADERPGLVTRVVAVEPGGLPYFSDLLGTPAEDSLLPWGLTSTPISRHPAASQALASFRHPDGDQAPKRWVPPEVEYRLATLADIPVLVVTGEASYHVDYHECIADYLAAGGVHVTQMHLREVGIAGNGHMMMLEQNSDAIAAAITDWLSPTLLGGERDHGQP